MIQSAFLESCPLPPQSCIVTSGGGIISTAYRDSSTSLGIIVSRGAFNDLQAITLVRHWLLYYMIDTAGTADSGLHSFEASRSNLFIPGDELAQVQSTGDIPDD